MFTSAIPCLFAFVVAQSAVGGRAAAAEANEPPAPVTPFIDSGNTFPDLAAPERHPVNKTPSLRGPWYGWQILLGDVAAASCALAFKEGACFTPYLLTGPGVHIAHRRYGLAAASLGLRVGGPALGAVVGRMLAKCPDRTPPAAKPSMTESDSPAFTFDLGSLDFCGLDWEDACADFHKNTAPTTTASAAQVRRRLYSTSVSQWRNYATQLMPLRQQLKAAGYNED